MELTDSEAGRRVDSSVTVGQVVGGEAVFDAVARLSAAPTLQAGVLLLGRPQHVVTTQTLRRTR